MLKNRFLLYWFGSKYLESKKSFNDYDFSKYETIIEPFGGTFGFSRFLYLDMGMKKTKYIVMDTDENLIKFFQYLQSINIQEFIKEYNKHIQFFKENYKLKDEKRKNGFMVRGRDVRIYIKTIENEYMKYMLENNMLSSPFSRAIELDEITCERMLKENITFLHQDFREYDFSIYDRERTLIYLDPPYLDEYNGKYMDKKLTQEIMDKMLYCMMNFDTIFVHSFNDKINDIFKEFLRKIIKKTYSTRKTKTEHYIYSNLTTIS